MKIILIKYKKAKKILYFNKLANLFIIKFKNLKKKYNHLFLLK